MKKNVLLIVFSALSLMWGCNAGQSKHSAVVRTLTDGIAYCESVLIDGDRVLVANFGTEELNPLNTEGKGYILEFKDTVSRVLIPSDGNLSAPKGMLLRNNRLFIADVGKMVVYNLDSLEVAPLVVSFPEGELFVNDMALGGDNLYVTVTNTGNIYLLDISDPANVDSSLLKLYAKIPGANGIVINGDQMYVASYPPDGVTTADNVLYRIADIGSPAIEKLTDRIGQYDGLALSADGSKLYFTSWIDGEVGYYDVKTNKIELIDTGVEFAGPARIYLKGKLLYIPDLPNSRVVSLRVE